MHNLSFYRYFHGKWVGKKWLRPIFKVIVIYEKSGLPESDRFISSFINAFCINLVSDFFLSVFIKTFVGVIFFPNVST